MKKRSSFIFVAMLACASFVPADSSAQNVPTTSVTPGEWKSACSDAGRRQMDYVKELGDYGVQVLDDEHITRYAAIVAVFSSAWETMGCRMLNKDGPVPAGASIAVQRYLSNFPSAR